VGWVSVDDGSEGSLDVSTSDPTETVLLVLGEVLLGGGEGGGRSSEDGGVGGSFGEDLLRFEELLGSRRRFDWGGKGTRVERRMSE